MHMIRETSPQQATYLCDICDLCSTVPSPCEATTTGTNNLSTFSENEEKRNVNHCCSNDDNIQYT